MMRALSRLPDEPLMMPARAPLFVVNEVVHETPTEKLRESEISTKCRNQLKLSDVLLLSPKGGQNRDYPRRENASSGEVVA